MKQAKSFFKREAVLTLLILVVPAMIGLLAYLFILIWRWLSR